MGSLGKLTLDTPVWVVTGALAFVWLVNQLIISARLKFIERHFGLDRMYRFHAVMAVFCACQKNSIHKQAKVQRDIV
jgi:predicted ferric reductase